VDGERGPSFVETVVTDGNYLFRKLRLCVTTLYVVHSNVRLRIRSYGIDIQVGDKELHKNKFPLLMTCIFVKM
jgi:hypothetical protein